MKKPTWESLNGVVQIFNATYKVGGKVNLKMDDDSIQEVTFCSLAQFALACGKGIALRCC